jgi:hypothetical protein
MVSMWIRATNEKQIDSTQVAYQRIWDCPFFFSRLEALEIYRGKGFPMLKYEDKLVYLTPTIHNPKEKKNLNNTPYNTIVAYIT